MRNPPMHLNRATRWVERTKSTVYVFLTVACLTQEWSQGNNDGDSHLWRWRGRRDSDKNVIGTRNATT